MKKFFLILLCIIVNLAIGLAVEPLILILPFNGSISAGSSMVALAIQAFLPIVFFAVFAILSTKIKYIRLKPICIGEVISIWVTLYYEAMVVEGESPKSSALIATVCTLLPFIVLAAVALHTPAEDITTINWGAGMSTTKVGNTTIDTYKMGDNLTIHNVKDENGNVKKYRHWKF